MPQVNVEKSRARVNRLAWLLDNSIKIPGVNARIGLDGLIGLVPGIGDVIGTVISSAVIVEAARMGIPKVLLLRMVFNVAIDALVGAVPILGDLFDLVWKANHRNVQLLNRYLDRPQETVVAGRFFVWGIGAMLAGMVLGLTVIGYFLVRGLLGLYSCA